MTGFMVLSSLRILALSTFYNTFKLYNHLPNEGLVCVNPWHLFPSHFHVPDQTQIGFYEGGGLLPSLFESFVGIPEGNNDGNEYVQSRLVKKEECEYVIDMYKAQIKDSYEIVNCEDYLDRTQTGISRYFYLGPKTWIKYCLFKRKS